MFKDNKLRLLMNLVGFTRHGEHHDPDATWMVPPNLTSTQLQDAIDLIRKFEFAPPVYEDGKAPEDFLRSKTAAVRRSQRRVDFDDDSDGVDNDSEQDRGEYALDDPTARKPDGVRKKLKRRKQAETSLEIDDEEKDRRADARRKKELEKQAKVKSTMYIHDSDDEDWDVDKDAAFFAREQALREETMTAFKKSLVFGNSEPSPSKKRKAEEPITRNKRQKTPPKKKTMPFDDSDDEEGDNLKSITSSRAVSEARNVLDEDSPDEAVDTPLSSQHIDAAQSSGDETPRKLASAVTKNKDIDMADAEEDDDEDENVPVIRRPVGRTMRAGFIIDSDSE